MTREEAIRILTLERDDWETSHCSPMYRREAFQMAIEALKNSSDLISRQDAIDAFTCNGSVFTYGANVCKAIVSRIMTIPAAQPEPSDAVYRLYKRAYEAGQRNAQPELHYDEWCTDCKEYDQERHCCPRWNRVIRETLKDARPDIIRCKDCKYADDDGVCQNSIGLVIQDDDDFCSRAERR